MIRIRNRRFMQPSERMMKRYARLLCRHLDAFISGELPKTHSARILYNHKDGLVRLTFAAPDAGKVKVTVDIGVWLWPPGTGDNMRFEDKKTYFEKPMKRIYWTKDQAWLDASEVIAATLSAK